MIPSLDILPVEGTGWETNTVSERKHADGGCTNIAMITKFIDLVYLYM